MLEATLLVLKRGLSPHPFTSLSIDTVLDRGYSSEPKADSVANHDYDSLALWFASCVEISEDHSDEKK